MEYVVRRLRWPGLVRILEGEVFSGRLLAVVLRHGTTWGAEDVDGGWLADPVTC